MYRKLPKIVSQNSSWTCWAAGMESWLDATPFRRKDKQSELVSMYATYPTGGLDAVSSAGTAERDFETLASDFSIEYEVKTKKHPVRFGFLNECLTKSHVLLIFKVSPRVAHTHVVYGVGKPDGKDTQISVMDPSPGIFMNKSIYFYLRRQPVIVGWAEII